MFRVLLKILIKWIIPGTTLSQNAYDKLHWSERYQLRNEWFTLVRYVCGIRTPAETEKCHITFIRVAKRVIDPLNVPSALKPVLDSLVEFGHVRGDTFNDVVVTTDQRKVTKGEEPHIEIQIEHIKN